MIADRLAPFGTTIFSEMTRLAGEHKAINLAQGFPDFEGPPELVEAAVRALRGGDNQYARSMGHSSLVHAIAEHQRRHFALEWDPMEEVVVFSGATEGIASSLIGLLNPGDEVIVFEPFYDSYLACLAMAGAVPKFATLRLPDFRVDFDELTSLISSKTKALLLNSPHNPTGKVFEGEELDCLAAFCQEHDLIVIADEVYEHLWFDDHQHRPIASLDGMKERTLSISSSGKTWSYTGWKIGWATGPKHLIQGAQAAHQFLTFSTATPLQQAIAYALTEISDEYYVQLRKMYDEKRHFLTKALEDTGLVVAPCQGTYFLLADFSGIHDGDDLSFTKKLIEEAGVAAIPPSVFYRKCPEEGKRTARFAFCKRQETLNEAARRLKEFRA